MWNGRYLKVMISPSPEVFKQGVKKQLIKILLKGVQASSWGLEVIKLPSNVEPFRPSWGYALRAVTALIGKWAENGNKGSAEQDFMEASEVDFKETPVLQIRTSRQ